MPIDQRALGTLALLGEPVRRALYDWVVSSGRAVSRDEAAAGAGVSRALAAFHLDRLVDEGLLTPEYRRLTGRTGPGAGRPAKLYTRAQKELSVSLPDRHYEVAARLFADAIEQLAGDTTPDPLRASARGLGQEVGDAARKQAGPRAGKRKRREALIGVLRDRGYEPAEGDDGGIRLRNCPFHALVDEHRPLVCGMNFALAEGLVEGLGDADLYPCLDSQPGFCCVAFRAEAGG